MNPATVGRWLLILFGAGFMALAARFFADPGALTRDSDVTIPTAKAIMEIRTVYGGVFFGLGLTVFVLALKRATLASGLWVLVFTAGATAAARLGAIALGQAPDPMFAGLLAIEVAGVAVALLCLRGLAAD